MSTEYIFDTESDLGRDHVTYLENILDTTTIACLDDIGVRPGQHCLDLGAGGGSITRWLAERVGPTGRVVSVDLETGYLPEQDGVEVYAHDITTGLPDDGPYDVIHARLLLMHLPSREAVLRQLVEALAPGGWLVLGEFSDREPRPLAAPTETDLELWERLQHLSRKVITPPRGVDWNWAHRVADQMAAAGLVEIEAVERSRTMIGGSDGCLLFLNLCLQAEPLLLEAGVTEVELLRLRELMFDPAFRTWFYQFVCTSGQKPV